MSVGPKSLITVANGESAFIVGLDAGHKATARLESLGIIPGTEISVLTNNTVGPLLVVVGEGRVIVERGIASKVLVA